MAASAPTPVAVEPNLEASGYGDERDSGYDSDMYADDITGNGFRFRQALANTVKLRASYTTSLSSDITAYKHENGRRYHAYKEGSYMYPNDEKEMDRLDIMHKLTEVTLGGKLNLAPIMKNPQRILDIGTGTGIWAIEMGDKYPAAEILGNDLSPIQPRWVPPNVRFEVDDVEAEWAYSQKFDYIHCRFMGNTIKDWPRLVRQCFTHTKPGGWVEFIDLDLAWQSPDGSLKQEHASLKFNNEFINAMRKADMEPCPGPLLEGWVKDAGFTDVHHEKYVLPVGTWPADKHLKEVGAWNYLQIMEGLEAFTFALFTRQLGYSKPEVDVICSSIRKEMKDPKLHMMFHLHVAYGKKSDSA